MEFDASFTAVRKIMLSGERDFFSKEEWDKYGLNIPFEEKNTQTIVIPKEDSRRSADPLFLQLETSKCFCDYTKTSKRLFPVSPQFSVIFPDERNDRAVINAIECGPEPKEIHFIELARLAQKLQGDPFVLITNIAGSGASIPQHFHAQIYRHNNSMVSLLSNFQIGTSPIPNFKLSNTIIKEIISPTWGIELAFMYDAPPEEVGKTIFMMAQQMRLWSQLKLSYNIYINTETPNVIRIIYRQGSKESPFALNEVQEIIEKYATSLEASKIRKSANGKWRWGWMENIGGLPARDHSFDNKEKFGSKFWKEIFEFMSIPKQYREAIIQRLTDVRIKHS